MARTRARTRSQTVLGKRYRSGSIKTSSLAKSSALKKKCYRCHCAELWRNTKGRTDSLALNPGIDGASTSEHGASQHERLGIAKALYAPVRRWQFRLLKIRPSQSRNAQIHCDLVVAGMIEPVEGSPGVALPDSGDIIEYEAISYTWGGSEFSATILCNGLDLPVTRSAHEVLSHLRLASQPRWVWIDSVCINQLDAKEKSSQVQNLMFRIYRRAKMILGYLDRPLGKCDRIVRFLDSLFKSKDIETTLLVRRTHKCLSAYHLDPESSPVYQRNRKECARAYTDLLLLSACMDSSGSFRGSKVRQTAATNYNSCIHMGHSRERRRMRGDFYR